MVFYDDSPWPFISFGDKTPYFHGSPVLRPSDGTEIKCGFDVELDLQY